MKHFFLTLILFSLFISCDDSKKYEGHWTNYYLNDYGYNETKSLTIENDSAKFNYPYFDYCNSYHLKIKNDILNFNNLSFSSSIEEDTLFLNPFILFVRDNQNKLYRYKPILKIKLPELPLIENTETNKDERLNFMYFGKRLDNDKYGLQLNDRYADLNEIPAFLAFERVGLREELIPFYSTVLMIDKSTPLNYIESIFHELKKVNQLKVKLVNTLDINYNDDQGLYYNYQGLSKRLPYFMENDFYVPKTLKNPLSPPPPPPPYFPLFDDQKLETRFVLLKKDTLFHNNNPISTSQLKTLANSWVKNKNAIFSLYDLESTYGNFLEMTAIINLAYQNERNTLSKRKFNKSLSDLNSEKMTFIKLEIPMRHVWSFSIPHYKSLVQENNSFSGLKVPNLDSASSAE